jgi:hypothetical protein
MRQRAALRLKIRATTASSAAMASYRALAISCSAPTAPLSAECTALSAGSSAWADGRKLARTWQCQRLLGRRGSDQRSCCGCSRSRRDRLADGQGSSEPRQHRQLHRRERRRCDAWTRGGRREPVALRGIAPRRRGSYPRRKQRRGRSRPWRRCRSRSFSGARHLPDARRLERHAEGLNRQGCSSRGTGARRNAGGRLCR